MKGVYLFALSAVVACASSGGGSGSPVMPTDRNIILEQEIMSVPSANLYDLIQKLRPQFLRSRGPTSITSSSASEYAMVYVDGRQYGDISSLRSLVSTQVERVQYFDANSAAQKFGMISGSGVIEVTTRH